MVSKKTIEARKAYYNDDVVRSKEAHDFYHNLDKHGENHNLDKDNLKTIIFGSLDGIITIFAIVSGCVGAKITPTQVIIIGIGNLFANAISMGFSEYTSSTAQRDFMLAEKKREEWEIENCPSEEKQEMIDIYMNKYKFDSEDARNLVEITFRNKNFFLEHMMSEELGLIVTNEDKSECLKKGIIMFLSFAVFGIIPLSAYVAYTVFFGYSDYTTSFLVVFFSTLTTLFILGLFKSQFTNQKPITCALYMVLNGMIAGMVPFLLGVVLKNNISE
ncbi:putative integral membrane protein [Plasmodium gaboni]|uniref:Iron transporter, putative n=1 Tax=Plasmodium gaboni TaxID=647221 RepID=A0A151LGD9_9APIC|nr:putative integral membrane protein [Plasmodium gaboni]KYN98040.1 putative integral membrane protein [Plasmodium gaboni]SOV16368.1 iron transporter, putative [Plasmodium gaboni]SOV23781.1 iron transporter, putative [Plasmodium sp. DRC-Itaito]